MQIDLRTVSITPQRNTFDHLVRRFGDKPASRYQEGTYDIQPSANLQYRPSWDPEHQLYDAARTRIVMADWYAFKDPRQYYYGSWALARARQQENTESNFEFVESRELSTTIPSQIRQSALDLLVPLRHVAWAANMNNTHICGIGYGTAITAPSMFHAMDNLGIAQYLTRIGLLLADPQELDIAKYAWLTEARWQPLRRYVEESLAIEDWFELYVAQNVVLDGLVYPLVYQQLVDSHFTTHGAASVSMLTAFMTDWFRETSRWTDSVIKIAASESDENHGLIRGWIAGYYGKALEAMAPLMLHAIPDQADSFMQQGDSAFRARLAKLKIEF